MKNHWCWVVVLTLTVSFGGALFAGDILRFDFSREIMASPDSKPTAPEKSLELPRCAKPPVIDGNISDEAWKEAALIRDLTINEPRTRVWACYDDLALYVAMECTDAPGHQRVATERARDDRVFVDDSIEMWFTPAGGASDYQFIVNAGNSFYDGRDGDAVYNPTWSHAVQPKKGEWTVEVAIPRAALEMPGGWTTPIGFNLGRNIPGSEPRSWYTAWGPTQKSVLTLRDAAVVEAAVPRKPPRPKQELLGDRIAVSGNALVANFGRLEARPQDRWIEAQLYTDPKGALRNSRLEAALFAIDDGKVIASERIVPGQYMGRLLVDPRAARVSAANLVIRVVEGENTTGRAATRLLLGASKQALPNADRVGLTVDVPPAVDAGSPWPATFGVPFPAGALWDVEQVRLVDTSGKEVPHQKEIIARWAPDGAIKWVRFDTAVSAGAGCAVEMAASTGAAPAAPVQVKTQDDLTVLKVAAVEYVLGKGVSPIQEIRRDGKSVATSKGTRGLYVMDQTGRLGSAAAEGETVTVESSGPLAACVRFEGDYLDSAGKPMARHITRIECFAGQPTAKITHTLVLIHDTNEVWFKDIGWEFTVAPGANPKAVFGVNRDKPEEVVAQPLGGAARFAYMLQDRHYRFVFSNSPAKPEDTHFSVVSTDATGKGVVLKEGSECGDWALLSGDAAGFMVACKDAARQHPKEFEVSGDKVVLRLFSNRAGEELDFRAAALAKRWNMLKWIELNPKYNFPGMESKSVDELLAAFLQLPSNAVAWSRTHELMLAPLPPAQAPALAPRVAGSLSFPVYVHVDPRWIYRTEALGPIHPKDVARFPEAEDVLQRDFAYWNGQMTNIGLYGFVEYQLGLYPFPIGNDPNMARWCYTYDLRNHLLLLYARSGERAIRDMSVRIVQNFRDGNFAHWNAPDKVKGMWLWKDGTEYGIGHAALPFSWERKTETDTAGNDAVDSLMTEYYLTCDRRTGECLREQFEATKRIWTPELALKRQMFILRLYRTLVQGYAFTGDADYAALARAMTDMIYDPQAELRMIKGFRYFSSYKISQDIIGLIDAWQVLGDERCYEMALRQARYLLDCSSGALVRYNSAQGVMDSFLYRQTRDPVAAQDALLLVRQIGSFYDPHAKKLMNIADIAFAAARVRVITEGLMLAEDAVARSNADRQGTAAWAGAEWTDAGGAVIVQKEAMEPMELRCIKYNKSTPDPLALSFLSGKPGTYGTDLNIRTTLLDVGSDKLRIEKYAPVGAYKVSGRGFVIADQRCPMVVYSPSYWRPWPAQRPGAKIYFNLPPKSVGAQIFFESPTPLFDPSGAPALEGKAAIGWVDLPVEKPGLWHFKADMCRLVRVRNLPPFFAFDDAKLYFEPPIPWSREEIAATAVAPAERFVPGVAGQALHVTEQNPFVLDGGGPRPSGDGTRFLPGLQGTIEFFYKPYWSSFDLSQDDRQSLVTLRDSTDAFWHCIYSNGRSGWDWTLYSFFNVAGPTPGPHVECRVRPIVFERDRWVHVAMVWGPPVTIDGPADAITLTIYINGRPGTSTTIAKARPAGTPRQLLLGPNAAFDELRISDIQRYTGEFIPPARGSEWDADRHTRALFHFDGNDAPDTSAGGAK